MRLDFDIIDQFPHRDLPTELTVSEVECRRHGQQILRDLELFLGHELAHPRQGRCIPFVAGNDHLSSLQGKKPW